MVTNGKISALLELVQFNPEYSGYENIFLMNGLGSSRRDEERGPRCH